MERINKPDADRFFATAAGEKGNDRCFDCNKSGPTWVSLRHAVFICTQCAAEHRALGLRLKSVLLDTFTTNELRRVKVGGNFRCDVDDFAEKYEKLKGHPAKIDRLVESSNIDIFDATKAEESVRLVVKPKIMPKFGKKVEKHDRAVPKKDENTSPVAEKAVPNSRSALIEKKELMTNKKEYKVGDAAKHRMGFGTQKSQKKDEK